MNATHLSSPNRKGTIVVVLAVLTLALAASAHAAPPDPDRQPVDLNSADVDLLQTVPGIGPALAKRIVEFREKEGPFEVVDDLLKIRGIGEKSLAKIRPFVKVGRER